jgi:phosphatidylserine decarboxylase
MMPKRFAILLQYLVPQRGLTWLAGWLSSRRVLWFKNWQINLLVKRYGASLADAASSDIADYPDFNCFFTRYLKPGIRPVTQMPDGIACPVDGCISQLGAINGEVILQAKDFDYTLTSLLGGSNELAREFLGGKFATIYLAPKDYHRIHMPFTGTLRETIFIPGQLFSVNQATVQGVPNLFARNERLVCLFDTALGPMAVILVGAMLVGSIKTIWGTITAGRQIGRSLYPAKGPGAIQLEKGAELGHFIMGSTVILLFPAETMTFAPELRPETTTKMGQFFGKMTRP